MKKRVTFVDNSGDVKKCVFGNFNQGSNEFIE